MDIEASFIMPTHGRAEVLDISVPLLLRQDYDAARYELIVIADGPDPRAQAVMDRLAAPNLHFAALAENRGPGAARNRAIEQARGRILVFVDDDSLVGADFLSRHLAHHEDADNRIVAGPIIDVDTPPDMANPPKAGFWTVHTNPFPGGNSSVARDRVILAGGFDESFRHYGWEDPELYARLARRKLQRRFERGAPIFHFKPQGPAKSFENRARRELMRGSNGAMYYAKHRRFGVGLQTKQLRLFHGLDRLLDGALGLEHRLQAALERGEAPASRLLRSLVLLHAEVSGGRRNR